MISAHHIRQAVERTQQALIVAEHKPSPKGQGGGSNTVEAPLPLPVGLISAKRELRDWLLDWCDLVKSGLDVIRTYDLTEIAMLEWLGTGERAEYLANHDAGMDFLEEITQITRQLESPYLGRSPKKYIGNYGGGAVYVREGQTEVTLQDGETHQVANLRAYNAAHMLDMEGTASDIAEIIKAFFGHDITPQKITIAHRNDKTRKEGKRLEPIRTEGKKHIYRVWDVLNRLC